jgi:Cys-rich repeat protein
MKASVGFLWAMIFVFSILACEQSSKETAMSSEDMMEADAEADVELNDPDDVFRDESENDVVASNNGTQAEECQVDEDCPIEGDGYTPLVSLNPIRCVAFSEGGPRNCVECTEHEECPSYSCGGGRCATIECDSDDYCNGLDMSDGSFDLFTTDNELKCIQPRPDGIFVCSECQEDSDCPSGVCRARQICARL